MDAYFPFYVAGKRFFHISREYGAWTREKVGVGWGLSANRDLKEDAVIQKL